MALLHVNFYSKTLRMASSIDVILPEPAQGIGVDGSAWDGVELLPCLYLLHGTTDDHTIWQRRTSIERYCAGRKLAVVMPNGHLSAYCNQKYGHNYLDFITKELPDFCSKMFRISTKREDTFIAGLSMGGYGALKAGLNYPEKYAMAAGLSSGVDRLCHLPEEWQDFKSPAEFEHLREENYPLFDQLSHFMMNFGSPAEYLASEQNNLFLLIRKQVERGVELPKLYLSCGTEDPLAWEPNVRFRALLDELKVPYFWEEAPGVHEWRLWDLFIQTVLDQLPMKDNKMAVL
ncbi:MAG: esterase family protein [Clostridia bacterium]|nr:esterase family protein [Clostridia bacterium]